MLKEFYDMKEEIKNSNNKQKLKLYTKNVILLFEVYKKFTMSKSESWKDWKIKTNTFIKMCSV